MDKNVLLQCLSTGRNLLEANSAFFLQQANSKKAPTKKKSKPRKNQFEEGKKLEHYFKGVSRGPDGNAVIEFAIPSRSENGVMRHCFIDVIPKGTTLFNLAKNTSKLADRMQILKDADVKCFCSCPWFNWYGAKYNMKHEHDSLAAGHHSDNPADDNGEDIAPNVRDPQRKNTLCAHLVAALKGMMTSAPSIMKQARELPPEEKPAPAPQPEQPIVGKKQSEETAQANVEQSDEEARDEAMQNAMESFSQEGGGVKTEETQGALDALADNINPSDDVSEEIADDPGGNLIGKKDEEEEAKKNHIFDYEQDTDLSQFDMPVDEDEDVSVDDDYVVEKPDVIELPKP